MMNLFLKLSADCSFDHDKLIVDGERGCGSARKCSFPAVTKVFLCLGMMRVCAYVPVVRAQVMRALLETVLLSCSLGCCTDR